MANGGLLGAWKSASFQNANTPAQQNFNDLIKQNPLLAYRYLADAGGNEFYNLFPNKNDAVFMLNTFKEPGTAQQSTVNSLLGVNASDIPAQMLYGSGGQVTGQFGSGNGPSAKLSNLSDPYYQSMSNPQAFAEAYRAQQQGQNAGGVGTPEWWNYVMNASRQSPQPSTSQAQAFNPTTGGGGAGGGTNPIPGYGMAPQQFLGGFGIPGYETGNRTAGGSWAGTTFGGAPYSGLQQQPIPQTDVTNPQSPYYRGDITTASGGTTPGMKVNPAVPYQTSWYLQTYGGKPPPFINIHEQLGKAMQGRQDAKPSFAWADPEELKKLRGNLPSWTSALGFNGGG